MSTRRRERDRAGRPRSAPPSAAASDRAHPETGCAAHPAPGGSCRGRPGIAARYQGGLDSYLQVLDAQRSLFQGELDLTRLRWEELTSVVQLYRALGGGWT